MMSASNRSPGEAGFVLHTYPFRDTSLVVEMLTRAHGRVGLVARGAKRPKSPLRAATLAFQPLLVSWSGRGELRTLTSAEWSGHGAELTGVRMICGYYLNELMVKLLPRDDPHEDLFDAYRDALFTLAGPADAATTLRRFELALLSAIGYAVQLDRDAEEGASIEAHARYAYLPERGAMRLPQPAAIPGAVELSGRTLLDMAAGEYSDARTAAEAKLLLRTLVGRALDYRKLHTRELLVDLHQLA